MTRKHITFTGMVFALAVANPAAAWNEVSSFSTGQTSWIQCPYAPPRGSG